ncbi:MOSC domain-containing protein [Plasticicumulans sp.]|uniref:MOSC domain-containing protein n=1 Tax=Plasticicumulans sp. TaxID=2307179 RepID=UPI002CF962DC|nr:MOSC domain-containing protein [Plasticicumulans sp.]HNF66697.1 MOSC domain-containing protein [Plasticicumulans sp.]
MSTPAADTGIRIVGLFRGRRGVLPEEGQVSAIFREPLNAPCRLGPEGIDGDRPVDRRWHGGPERALLHYPGEHYEYWRRHYPQHAAGFVPGGFGENLTTSGLTEAQVRIGQRFRIGTALVEVSQPRRPCWKLDHRHDLPGLSRAVEATRRSGWLYRVCEAGDFGPQSPLIPEGSPDPQAPSVQAVWDAWIDGTDPATLARLAGWPTLAPVWRQAFAQRLAHRRG